MSNYLNIALWLVLFYDALIMLALPSTVTYIAGTDGGVGRFICYLVSFAITACVLYLHGFKKLPILALGLLLGFIVFSSFHCPNIGFDSLFTPRDSGIFNFKPMFECFLYFGLFMAMYSIPIDHISLEKIYHALALSGIIISIYIVLQHFHMDQVYRLTDGMTYDHLSRNPEAGGFISQPVYASALLVMLLPFMIRLNGWLCLLGALAILLTGNRSGLVALAILMPLFCKATPRFICYLFVSYMVILALTMAIYWHFPQYLDSHIQSSGRLAAWKQIIQDFITPAFPGIDKSYTLTGEGIGAFSILFPFYNHSSFYQAHNEYLETFRGMSFIGLFLLFKTQFAIFNNVSNRFIFAALMGISIFALTNPVWHIPTLAFMTTFLAGLGLNVSIKLPVRV